VNSETGSSGGGDYGGGTDAPPPLDIPPGSWRGYASGKSADSLAAAFEDGWNHRPEEQGNKPVDASIVVHGNNPITGYSVIMKGHGGGGGGG
jgi:hypothetical protein